MRSIPIQPFCLRLSSLLFLTLLMGVNSGCAGKPLNEWTASDPPLALVPVADAGVDDRRGEFRNIFCEVLESDGADWPDYRPCEEALVKVGTEPSSTRADIPPRREQTRLLTLLVPGVGWECIEGWLKIDEALKGLIRPFGEQTVILPVDGLSSSERNATMIRDYIMNLPPDLAERPILLIGYSKGAPDILEAVVRYPELRQRVAAVLSAAGAIGGSPHANSATQNQLNIMQYFPGSDCSEGDGGAVESLRPGVRRAWLAENELPPDIRYYSLVTYPRPDRVSSALKSMYNKLSQVDSRNDSQVIYYDQIIPGSTLLGFVNADHWALAVPIAREHQFIGSTFVDKNDFPREALIEAVLRFVEADLNF